MKRWPIHFPQWEIVDFLNRIEVQPNESRNFCNSRLLKTGAPFRDGVFGALRPPWIPSVLFVMAPRSIFPSIVLSRRNTSANVDRRQTISSCWVNTRRSKSCTRPNKLDFSDSNISSENGKLKKKQWKMVLVNIYKERELFVEKCTDFYRFNIDLISFGGNLNWMNFLKNN